MPTFLLDRDPLVQAEMLSLLLRMSDRLTFEQLCVLLDPSTAHAVVNVFPSHSDAGCRLAYYKCVLFMAVQFASDTYAVWLLCCLAFVLFLMFVVCSTGFP